MARFQLFVCGVLVLSAQCAGHEFNHRAPSRSSREDVLHRRRVLRSLNRIKVACRGFSGVHAGSLFGSVGYEHAEGLQSMSDGCKWVKHYLKRKSVKNDSPDIPRELSASERVLLNEDLLPWYLDASQAYYPIPNIIGLAAILAVIVFLWESLWLRSTTVRCSHKRAKSAEKKARDKVDVQWEVKQVEAFWKRVDAWGAAQSTQKGTIGEAPQVDSVRFTRKLYRSLAANGKAVVGVERTGPCAGQLIVKVKTAQRDVASFASKAGKAFEATEKEIVFEKGERMKLVEVRLFESVAWSPGHWFKLEMERISGSEVVSHHHFARVFIIDPCRYPGNVADKGEGLFGLLWAFYHEFKRIRGQKLWMTMLGVLYKPFHVVVVTSMVQKHMIDFATNPKHSSDPPRDILLLASALVFSMLISRWADVVQTKNRGRTGGIRMTHRTWLFDKLLLLGQNGYHSSEADGSEWFYAALHDVDSITMDIYWQFFMVAQVCASLLFTVLVIISFEVTRSLRENEAFQATHLLPSALLIILVPVSLFLTRSRAPYLSQIVAAREHAEEQWIDLWGWLAHSGDIKFGMGLREITAYETTFTGLRKSFEGVHQQVRDYMNDSGWISFWMGFVGFVVIMVWGAFALWAGRANIGVDTMKAGEFAVMIKLFSRLGGYLHKLNQCFVKVLRGNVALRKVQRLLNLGADELELGGGDDTNREDIPQPNIEVRGVEYRRIKGKENAWVNIKMKEGKDFTLPLGRFVRMSGTDDSSVNTVLALIADVIRPYKGEVIVPSHVSVVMLPEIPVSTGASMTIAKQIELLGRCDHAQSSRLASVFGLHPDHLTSSLPPGARKKLALLKAMLRDPDVLILPKPLAFVPDQQRKRILLLLRLWQAEGGAQALLRFLSDDPEGEKPLPDQGSQRTAIIYDPNLPGVFDMEINLDTLLDQEALTDRMRLALAIGGASFLEVEGSGSVDDTFQDEPQAEVVGAPATSGKDLTEI